MALVGDNGAGKSTLIKCIAGIHGMDEGEMMFDGDARVRQRPERRGEARDRGRVPGSRALRQPRRRPEHVPRPRGESGLEILQEPPMEAKTRETLATLRVTTIRSIRQAGRDALRRPAPVSRGRAGGDVELEARHPRRADRGARRRADGAGARARQPAGRAGPRRGPDLAQPARRVRDGDADRGPAPRAQRRGLRAREYDAAGGRARDHRRTADEGRRASRRRRRGHV